MLSRREFCAAMGTGLAAATAPAWSATPFAADDKPRKKLAIICTHWTMQSHAQHMGDRFLTGYPLEGSWHHPPLDVVALYVDQTPEKDQSKQRAEEYGFKIYPTVAEAVCLGGDKLAVDAVLIIGEHGKYPLSEYGQIQYPRYEFFKAVTDVYRKSGQTAPIFNEKHLSWNYDWAREMVAISKELKFPFLAGSSLPMTWRMPDIELPLDSEPEEILVMSDGNVDVYDFHALETLQCLAERRKGGETGLKWLQATRGDGVWTMLEAASWDKGGWSPQLFEACLSRSQTLGQAREGFGHRYPDLADLKKLVAEPIAYRFQYNDGLKATMLLMNGLVSDFNAAVTLKGEKTPWSTMFHLPPKTNVVYSAALMSKAEEMFLTGKAPYPVERTLLTSGLVSAGMESLHKDGKKLHTPHLAVSYQPPKEPQFWRK